MSAELSYHDLFVTVEGQKRVRFSDLGFGHMLICTRVGAWELWFHEDDGRERLVAGEFDETGLRLDVAGHVIVDSIARKAA